MATPTADLTLGRFITTLAHHLPAELAADERVIDAAIRTYEDTCKPDRPTAAAPEDDADYPNLIPLINRTLLEQFKDWEPEPVKQPAQAPGPARHQLTAGGKQIKRKGRAAYKVLELTNHPNKWRVLDRASPTAARATSYRYYDGVDALAEPNTEAPTPSAPATHHPPTSPGRS